MDVAAPQAPLSDRLLQDYLRQDVITREASITRFMCGMSAVCMVGALSVGSIIGWKLALSLAGMLAVLCAYYGFSLWTMKRGRLYAWMQWVDTVVMVSIPAVVFVIDWRFQGAEYALTTPPLVVWGALIVVCALRAGKVLAYVAASLAAVEYYLLYTLLALPHLPPETLSTLTPPLMAMRALFLFSYGPLTATLASHLLRKAGDALRAIREKDVMGKYFLHERVGVGGMAEVFRATYSPEGGFEKQVAVKRVLPAFSDNAEFMGMFRREAELGSMLIHPNVVQVLDLGRHQNLLFLAMEFVDGMSLGALLQLLPERRLPPAAVAYLGAELAGALAYVHSRTGPKGEPLNLVHRDINPPNVLLSFIGEVKLTDFGIARAAHQVSLTQSHTVRGKAGYMAPEQVYAQQLDGRADLFALGLTLHEALTGQPALQGDTDMALMLAATRQNIVPPSQLMPHISPAMDRVIMGLLQPELEQRTPSGEVLQRQLSALTGHEAPYPQGRQLLVEALKRVKKPTQPLQLTSDMALTEKLEAQRARAG